MSAPGMSYDYHRTATLQGDQKKVKDLAAKLKKHLADLEDTLKTGADDGKWDPVQGIGEDLVDDSKKLLKLAKAINKARDSRGGLFMR